MKQGSNCLSWEPTHCSTFARGTSGYNFKGLTNSPLGAFASKSQCPLRAGVRQWSNWAGNGNRSVTEPGAAAGDENLRVGSNLTSSSSPSAQDVSSEAPVPARATSLYRDVASLSSSRSSSTDAVTSSIADGTTILPSRPKMAQLPQAAHQWSGLVEENRLRHSTASQTSSVGANSTLHDPQGKITVEINAVRSRCRPRRRLCGDTVAAPPPKLRRDTDCTESIVRLIVFFSTKLVHAIWSQAAVTPKSSKDFNGAGVLPLQVFIQETLRRSKTSYSTLQVALFYLILLRPHVKPCQATQQQYGPGCRALQCGRRMFLTALILASKYLQDRNYSARAWSKISGLPVSEINENEIQYLELIKYNLHMTKETFENWSKVVLTTCKASGQGPFGNRPDSPPSSPNGVSHAQDFERPGCAGWWSHHLLRLTPDVVKDSKLTEEYLATLATGAPLVDQGISLDTPPSSPESLEDMISDTSSPRVVASSGPAQANNIPQTLESGQSPGFAGSVPSRPFPPNLPTPQTTPRYDSAFLFSRKPSHSDLRCRASMQALHGLDKQALNAANLETCPPPKPRHCAYTPSVSSIFSTTASDTSVASLTSSPESVITDFSACTSRSRSSSMSSNSSVWSLTGSVNRPHEKRQVSPSRGIHLATSQAKQSGHTANIGAYGFYHAVRPTALSSEDTRLNNRISSWNSQQPQLRLGKIQEGPPKVSSEGTDLNDAQVAELLASLNSTPTLNSQNERSTGPAATKSLHEFNLTQNAKECGKTHKRNRSSKDDTAFQQEIRQFIHNEHLPVCVEDDKKPTTYVETSDKQAQYPLQDWAHPKKPICNALRNKRVALQHASSPEQKYAPELAADFLRRDVTVM